MRDQEETTKTKNMVRKTIGFNVKKSIDFRATLFPLGPRKCNIKGISNERSRKNNRDQKYDTETNWF